MEQSTVFERQKYRCVTDVADIRTYIGSHSVVAFDYETAPDERYRDEERAALDPAKSHIAGCSFSVEEGTAIYVPIAHRVGMNCDGDKFIRFLREFLTNPATVKVAHNLAFEAMMTYHLGIVIQPPVYDTIAAAQLTQKSRWEFRTLKDSGLKFMALQQFGVELPSFTDVTTGRHFDEMDPQEWETVRYGCADSDFTLRLYHKCNRWFDKYLPQHRWLVENVESPTAVYVGMMKHNGVPVDLPAMKAAKAKAAAEIKRVSAEISDLTGGVDTGSNCSTKAFKEYLYQTLKLPVMNVTDKGQPSVDDEAMVRLREYCEANKPAIAPLFDLVLEYRKWQKLMSTYLDGYLRFFNETTGCIHPELMPLATETGRFACRRPNLQNQISPGADPVGVRNFVTAPRGWTLMEADYSQAEIRLAAYLANDRVLLDAYRHGTDVHAITTSAVFRIPLEEAMDHSRSDYKHRRTVAKQTMFGIMYGIGGSGLSRNLYTNAGIHLTKEECNSYINGILAKYTGIAAWQKSEKRRAYDCMYTQTAFGRRRYLPEIRSEEYWRRGAAERMAINTPVQGLCADCLKLAMGRLIVAIKDKPYIRPILTVHDSLVFLVKEGHEDEAAEIVKRCMEEKPPLENFDPLVAEVSTGRHYGEMK